MRTAHPRALCALSLVILTLLMPALATPATATTRDGTYVTGGAPLPEACPVADPPAVPKTYDNVLDTATIHFQFLGDAHRLTLDVYDLSGTRPYVFLCVYDNGELKHTAGGYGTAHSVRTWDEFYAWVLPLHQNQPIGATVSTVGTWEAYW